MKKIILITYILFSTIKLIAQPTRIAILDFENISGIAKYDGLGKAMSSMLISDIEANVSPKRLQLVERAQIQKVLKEQKFQTSGSVNKNTAVQAGKILGVNYLLVGDVFVLNDQLILNARLTNTETGDIIFSKKQEGKITGWLLLKTNIAKEISSKLNLPIESKELSSKTISESSLLLYANGINYLDKNEIDSANNVLTELKYTEKDFKYTDSQLNHLFELASSQSVKNTLKQKAYILNLHKRISNNPIDAWSQIETFWNGPLDDNYPYLEYLFLINLYEKFVNDSTWLNYPISRHGVNAKLGDMILYSISSHANHCNEIKTAIYYNQIREKLFPSSEMSLIWGEPIDEHNYRWELIDDPNEDTIYCKYLTDAQDAIVFGLGSRNEKIMKDYLLALLPLLNQPFYEFIPSEYYYEIEGKKIPIFNPYDVLGTLIVLVGNKEHKIKAQNFYEINAQRKIYTGLLQDNSWFRDEIDNSLLIRYASSFNSSTFDDYQSKKWTKDDFSDDIYPLLLSVTITAISLQTLKKYTDSYEILSKLGSFLDNNLSLKSETILHDLTVHKIYYIVQLRNSIRLGKADDVKYISKQLSLYGIDPNSYSILHTELYD